MKKMRKFIRFGKNNCEKPLERLFYLIFGFNIPVEFRIYRGCHLVSFRRKVKLSAA